MKRRDFLVKSAVMTAGVGMIGNPGVLSALTRSAGRIGQNEQFRELAMRALDAARSAGAEYTDVRISRNQRQSVSTREQRITGIAEDETFGFGVRVLAGGSWGFAASYDLTPDEVVRVARQAVSQAKANAVARRTPVELAPAEVHPDFTWTSPIKVDPFDIPIEEKVDLLLRANAAALTVPGARFVTSGMSFLREEKFFASSLGTVSDQTIYRSSPRMNITAVSADNSDFQSRESTDVAPRALGYEHVTEADFVGMAPRWAEEAVQKLSAKPVQPGRYDLVLLPTHLWLTVHEAVAHPTELDRIMGFEANYAGTSFVKPEDLGKLRFGSELMNIQGERSSVGGLSTVGIDDEGVRPHDYMIIENGILVDLQTTREQAPWLAEWYRQSGREMRSHGNSYAQSWADVQFQRMPNVNLMPHPERDVELGELIEGVENGIMIDGDGSFSIDQQRYNAQFGGQVFHEIKNGKVTGMLKDVAYQIRTPEFWASMDLIGGPSTYFSGGSGGDGKGQPAQSNAVSHGGVPTRHRGVTVINTGRRS